MGRHSEGRDLGLLFRILIMLLVMALLAPKFCAILLESFIPVRPSETGPHVREVLAPVRVSSFWDEVEVWWRLVRLELERYYRGE
ncbi:MAG: hypothetical protein R6U70_03015 [Bacillota bacterium]